MPAHEGKVRARAGCSVSAKRTCVLPRPRPPRSRRWARLLRAVLPGDRTVIARGPLGKGIRVSHASPAGPIQGLGAAVPSRCPNAIDALLLRRAARWLAGCPHPRFPMGRPGHARVATRRCALMEFGSGIDVLRATTAAMSTILPPRRLSRAGGSSRRAPPRTITLAAHARLARAGEDAPDPHSRRAGDPVGAVA